MNLARASWISVVGLCLLTAVLLQVSGYTGYAITACAVAAAAGVNLLPRNN